MSSNISDNPAAYEPPKPPPKDPKEDLSENGELNKINTDLNTKNSAVKNSAVAAVAALGVYAKYGMPGLAGVATTAVLKAGLSSASALQQEPAAAPSIQAEETQALEDLIFGYDSTAEEKTNEPADKSPFQENLEKSIENIIAEAAGKSASSRGQSPYGVGHSPAEKTEARENSPGGDFLNNPAVAETKVTEADAKTGTLDGSPMLGRANADQLKDAGLENGVNQKDGSVYINKSGQMAYKYTVTEANLAHFNSLSSGKHKVGDEVEAVKADSGTGWVYANQEAASNKEFDKFVDNEFDSYRNGIEGAEAAGMKLNYAGQDENSINFTVGEGDFELSRDNATGNWTHQGKAVRNAEAVQEARAQKLNGEIYSLKDKIENTPLKDKYSQLTSARDSLNAGDVSSLSALEKEAATLQSELEAGLAPISELREAELAEEYASLSKKAETIASNIKDIEIAKVAEFKKIGEDAVKGGFNQAGANGMNGFAAYNQEKQMKIMDQKLSALNSSLLEGSKKGSSNDGVNSPLRSEGVKGVGESDPANPLANKLLEFSATWCGPCRQMVPAVQKLEKEGQPIMPIDVDARRDLMEQYNISSLPTLILTGPDGKEIQGSRKVGVTTEDSMRSMMSRLPK